MIEVIKSEGQESNINSISNIITELLKYGYIERDSSPNDPKFGSCQESFIDIWRTSSKLTSNCINPKLEDLREQCFLSSDLDPNNSSLQTALETGNIGESPELNVWCDENL